MYRTTVAAACALVGSAASARAQNAIASDYPPQAIAERRERVTKVDVLIGADGLVKKCAVQSSSGSTDFDEKACIVAFRSFKFTPARENGFAVESTKIVPIRWEVRKKTTNPAP
ncbi:energy transducer TonB [Polymorphobacter sp. PAMC 29334]|uniref:energy transducer TonB n=1 Tax=Polymorphobacter sp. PAMC 29334 TaxID=2862331 RepID=UPI001C66D8E4|nr:energy transducer TonB [Polymorphobacter sp. PAMC 29334]QYE35523.1 energy transducer TonB [Polymorphobacter sp. PAMC 29334]